uniref:RRM domain-containing protein n=1 Tax=Plectus sambesii TaxID=2011161 RepID=A0A914X6P3_9BILA
MMATFHSHAHGQAPELDSSHNTSSASLVPSVPYPSAQHWAQVPSALPLAAQPAYELIQHRVFVGGFPSATNENELRTFFEKYGHIREAKVIRTAEGSSKGYGFVTFDSEEEAQIVRNLSPDKLEFKGRRLNLGPAMRRITHNARFTDFAMACPTPMLASPTFAGYYPTAHPQTPTYVLLQPNGQVPSFIYSPVSPQHQLQQQNGGRYITQNATPQPPPPCPPTKQHSANESIEENRGQSSPKQQTLQLPQQYYASQPMTPMTPGVPHQPLRHLHQMQNFVATHGGPYGPQPTMHYYAAPNPTDMTHYSQMAMPAGCYYTPPSAMSEQQQRPVQPQYNNCYDMNEQEQQQQRSSMWTERTKMAEPNKTLSPAGSLSPPTTKPRNADDNDRTPKAKPAKRIEPRQFVKDCPADPLTPEKQQQIHLGARLNRLRPAPVRYYRVPFDGNRGKSVSLPSSPAAFPPPTVSSPGHDSPNAAATSMMRAGQQAPARSPRKSVMSLAAQMSQVQIHGSPSSNNSSLNIGY